MYPNNEERITERGIKEIETKVLQENEYTKKELYISVEKYLLFILIVW